MSCLNKILFNLLVIILIIVLQAVSNKTMGLVLVSSPFQSLGFGMGKRRACFHSVGISPDDRQSLNKISNFVLLTSPKYLRSSYKILEGPPAFSFGKSFKVKLSSSKVVLLVSKPSRALPWLGLAWLGLALKACKPAH